MLQPAPQQIIHPDVVRRGGATVGNVELSRETVGGGDKDGRAAFDDQIPPSAVETLPTTATPHSAQCCKRFMPVARIEWVQLAMYFIVKVGKGFAQHGQ